MSKTRYGHSSVGGGNQDQRERKDDGWVSRQGGDQSSHPGRKGEAERGDPQDRDGESRPPRGTNTQGDMAGIAEDSHETLASRDSGSRGDATESGETSGDGGGGSLEEGTGARSGTDQPPRMGGPLGPDPKRDPHLPEGAQDTDNRGSGAGGFDRGVNAKVTGAIHQGARPEEKPD